MDSLIINLLLVVLSLGLAVFLYIFVAGDKLTGDLLGRRSAPPSTDDTTKEIRPIAEIFYMFNHESTKHWTQWISKQNPDIRQTAFEKLAEHLSGNPAHWGFVTPEALNALTVFDPEPSFDLLVEFTQKARKLWGEYKSIPSYYSTAILLLSQIKPDSALKVLEDELDQNLFDKADLEKKKLIIDTLGSLKETQGVTDLLFRLISDDKENIETRKHALNSSLLLKRAEIIKLYRLLAEHYVRIADDNLIKNKDEIVIVEEFSTKAIRYISDSEFFPCFESACKNKFLKRFIVKIFVKQIESDKTLNVNQMYAISKLEDTLEDDLKKTLSQKASLDENELKLVLELLMDDLSEEHLSQSNIEEYRLPIPNFLNDEYKEVCDLFFRNKPDSLENSEEKLCGGLLFGGNDELLKLYYTRAFALEKKWKFLHIDVSKVNDKDSYDKVHQALSKTTKPCILFIKNPQLLYGEGREENTQRQKLLHTLNIQSMDKKCFLAGSISPSSTESSDKNRTLVIEKLRDKFFPQSIELNSIDESGQRELAEKLLEQLSQSKKARTEEFLKDLAPYLTNKNSRIELYFYLLGQIKASLLVFEELRPIEHLERLEAQLRGQNLAHTN